jgi:FtsZ-interacting cell division protein ZipA
MTRADLVGGLNIAMQRGYSLKDAMISLHNTGYNKQDIEEAARYISSTGGGMQMQVQSSLNQKQNSQIPQPGANEMNQQSQQAQYQQGQQQLQIHEAPKKSSKTIIIVLIILLFLLIAGVAGVFLFLL